MRRYKIFVSGVQKEFKEERKTVREIVKANIFLRQYFEVFLFEAIVNAVAHRDYYSNASVQVIVFIDRIEIWNPGRLPFPPEELKKPHISKPYNPLISEPLYLTDYIQKVGSGTTEMIKQCKEKGLPEPDFIQKTEQVVAIIWKDIFTDEYLFTLGLNERQMKAVKYVKERSKIANKEYREMFNISKPTATRELSNLVNKKVFSQMGIVGQGTYYTLKK